jgi:hypothetical protein
LSPEEKAFVIWAEGTCVAWAESFNRQLNNGEKYRILPDECIEFYKMYGVNLPLVVSSLHRYEKEVVNGDKRVVVQLDMLGAEMALRWQNQMLDSIRYPNPVRDAILRAAMTDAQSHLNRNLNNTEAYKLSIPNQNYFPTAQPQYAQPNPQMDAPLKTCSSCNGSGSRNFACYSCNGTGVELVGGIRYKCRSCTGRGFEMCVACGGSGKSRF